MKKNIGILVVLISVLLAATNSHAIGLEVAVGGWAQSPEGRLAYQSDLLLDSFDLESNAGYGEEDQFFGRVNIDLPLVFNLYFMGTPMEFEGDGFKVIPFDFGGSTFSQSFYSRAKLDHYDLALYYGVPLTGLASLGTLGIDIGLNVRYLDIDMVVRDKTVPSLTESIDETFYIPMAFLAVQFKPTDNLALETEFRGSAYSDSHYYDLIGRFKYRFAGLAFAAAGWRYQDMEIDEKDILAAVKISGPFLEVGLQY